MFEKGLVVDQGTNWREVAHGIDDELDRLRRAVAMARHQDWRGGDVIEPEFENFIARLGQREAPVSYPSGRVGAEVEPTIM